MKTTKYANVPFKILKGKNKILLMAKKARIRA
jgi:hypothetical protein